MKSPADFAAAFREAQSLQAKGLFPEAEQAYRALFATGDQRALVLEALATLYLQARRPRDAVAALSALVEESPDSLGYCARLAVLLEKLGRREAAIDHYQRLLRRQPELAAAHFNVALLYRKEYRYEDSLAAYEEAMRLGISNEQEVWSNMGVVYADMRDTDKAEEMYRRALAADPVYLPALFNLAGLNEEAGRKEPAISLYRRILEIDPKHWDSLTRLAWIERVDREDDPLLESLRQAIGEARNNALAQESLHLALGKVLDDLGRYDEAFASCSAANELGKRRNPLYEPRSVEAAFDHLIEVFDASVIRDAELGPVPAPIFICGMFRSGSSLVEQILASHPSIAAGGELDLLPRVIRKHLLPYPQQIRSASPEALHHLRDDYLAVLHRLAPPDSEITDKRPDNFLHLGLIRILFPSARIVYTRRNLADNCLSLYFQQLGGNLHFATDLESCAHYYRQHERLIAHWQASFGDNIFTVDYDALVRAPEPLLRRLLNFLGLEWDERCLQFQKTGSLVKTASVWQVRDELHTRSSGRWRNYSAYLQNLEHPVTGSAPEAGADIEK
ncbi:MAG: sulfotransferase [Woeseia sp.]